MTYKAGDKIDCTDMISLADANGGCKPIWYEIMIYHRNKNPEKSQWLISCEEKINCFVVSIKSNWIGEYSAWGLLFNNGNLEQIGSSKDDEKLFLPNLLTVQNEKNGMAIRQTT
jgi:hypothetical protein